MADLEALADLTTPWCVHVVATLRIADHVAAGAATIDELAAAAECDADALRLVLDHLVTNGVFEEPEPARFALNDAARQLIEVSPWLDLDGIGGRFAEAWSTLLTYVRTGRPAYAEQVGVPFWDDLAAHPELGAQFDAMMGPEGHGAPEPRFDLEGGWDGVRTVVDVGGGTGAMLAELLRARPGLRGTLVERPGTAARAELGDVADRVSVAAQSFFDPLPAGADVYLLRHVLNDWPTEETVAILRRCAEAARPAGRVVVMGGVKPGDEPSRLTPETVLVGGRTDSLATFRGLARRAGLEVVAAGPQRSGYFVVECRPD
jgi:hypothetical protein